MFAFLDWGVFGLLIYLLWGLSSTFTSSNDLIEAGSVQHAVEIHDSAHNALYDICHIHYILYDARPFQEPMAAFDSLGLDASSPRLSDPARLKRDTPEDRRAKEKRHGWETSLMGFFTERTPSPNLNDDEYDKAGRLISVIAALLDPEKVNAVTSVVMPEIAYLRGEARLKALRKLCGGHWKAI